MLGDRRAVHYERQPDGWGAADDGESMAAIRRALELGITFFDTADVYGARHGEEVLGRALADRRDEVVIATKFGYTFDAGRRAITGQDASPGYIRRACRASIRGALTAGGRTLAQGALGWLLGRSPCAVPIPGIRTVAQAEQNAAALRRGPLPPAAMAEIARLLGTAPAQSA